MNSAIGAPKWIFPKTQNFDSNSSLTASTADSLFFIMLLNNGRSCALNPNAAILDWYKSVWVLVAIFALIFNIFEIKIAQNN